MRVCMCVYVYEEPKRQGLAFSPVVITSPASLIFASVSKAIIVRTVWILISQSGYRTISIIASIISRIVTFLPRIFGN